VPDGAVGSKDKTIAHTTLTLILNPSATTQIAKGDRERLTNQHHQPASHPSSTLKATPRLHTRRMDSNHLALNVAP
jgi:hypothetical protein